jgi:hypothetical protein
VQAKWGKRIELTMNSTQAIEISFQLQPGPRAGNTTSATLASQACGRLPRVTQVLALAIQFEDMLARGEAKDYADIARLGGLCRERVSQIMRLNYLAPDIQVELLYLPPTPTGRFPISETSVRKIAGLLSWAEQRSEWAQLKDCRCVG